MDDKLKELLGVKADPWTVIQALKPPEVWRFTSAIVAICGYRAATAKRHDIERVCARFINDLAAITDLPPIGKEGGGDA